MTLNPGLTQQQADQIYNQHHFHNIHRELSREKAAAAQLVRQEFQGPQVINSALQQELNRRQGGEQVVYGGTTSSTPEELQLVRAWRPSLYGEWDLGTGVVHSVDHEHQTVVVQFLPDQHRCRLPWMSVKPILDITPTYPKIRLAPGERLPTRAELLQREQEGHARRQALGIPPNEPLPGDEDPNSLRAGEVLNDHGRPVIEEDRFGIPAPTLDALRNTSIPSLQVGAEYGPHFYTKLYRNNFYSQPPYMHMSLSTAGHLEQRRQMNSNVVSHKYIPLEGPELEQDLRTGNWRVARDGEDEASEHRSFFEWLANP